jgi:CRP-like cAMP-binding protein
MTTTSERVLGFELFADSPADQVTHLVDQLRVRRLEPGEVLIEEGAVAVSFFLLIEGTGIISRSASTALEPLRVAPGSILGELGILRGRLRGATVRALTPMVALEGDASAFALLLGIPSVRDRIARTVARRLAQNAHRVPIELAGGDTIELRPILPTDRDVMMKGLEGFSHESRRRRFFSAAPLSEHFLDYLVDIDYLDHFGWVATTSSPDPRWIGSARYIRDLTDAHVGDVGVGVVDDHQGKGIGRCLLGALGVVAPMAGITQLRTDVLAENAPMRAVVASSGSTTSWKEPGVLTALLNPLDLQRWLSDEQLMATGQSARDILIAANLALTEPVGFEPTELPEGH